MALPDFIDPAAFPNCQQVPWPYTFKMKSQWYLLPASWKTLQKVCDDWLGLDPGKLSYVNLMDHAILAVNDYTYLHPDDPPYAGRGFLTAREIAFCVMAAKLEDGVPSGITLFTPLIFIDDPMAAVTGLAVFGVPKQVSQIEIPPDVESPSPTNLSTWVFPTLGSTSQLVMQQVLAITADPATAGAAVRGFASYSQEIKYIFDQHKRSDLDPHLAAQIDSLFSGVDSPVTLTALKQFRDAQSPAKACYQAIVEAKMKDLKDFSGGFLKGTYDVALSPSGSLPISSALGTGALNAVGGFWFDLQLKFGYAENVLVNAG